MRCPFCGELESQVKDSRPSEDGAAIRRRRRCPECDKRFTTYERVELGLPAVVKKDGSRVDFDRNKLAASLQLALRKRPVSAESVADAVARIEYQLLGTGEREIRSEQLGELVMNELRRLDKIAYVRFASVYRRFEYVSEFQDLLQEIRNPGPQKPGRKR